MIRLLPIWPALFPLLFALACSDPAAPRAAAVTIAPRVSTLALGDSVQLTATATDAAGRPQSGMPVTWTSSDSTILRIMPTGLVRATAAGPATITAAVAGVRDTLAIAVTVQYSLVAQSPAVSCVVATNHAGFCWGANEFGQLGDGTLDSAAAPVPVSGGLHFFALAPGEEHTCGIAADSAAYCWGLGSFGAIGSGDTLSRLTPTAVAGGDHYAQLAVGDLHACGLTAVGTARCWGYNGQGQAGDTAHRNLTAPTSVAGGLQFAGIAAGGTHTCGITLAHQAYCWGSNAFGELGNYTDTVFQTPVPVTGSQTYQAVSARGESPNCGIATDGTVRCWGLPDALSPRAIAGSGRFVQISTAYLHGCGIATDSLVSCWNWGLTPQALPGGIKFLQVGTGPSHDCGVASDSTAYCWLFHCGVAADVACNDPPQPVAVLGGRKFTAVSATTDRATCGLAVGGTVYCWFAVADSGRALPRAVPGGPGFVAISMGNYTFGAFSNFGYWGCGIGVDSAAYCWGVNQVASPPHDTTSAATSVLPGLQLVSLDAGGGHLCGLAPGGAASCWDGSAASPTIVPGGNTFMSVSAGSLADCGVTTGHAIVCWGRNPDGELGIGFGSRESRVPTPVLGGHAFLTLTASADHTCGISTDSTTFCWGTNSSGALGTGNTTPSTTPAVVTGGYHFAAITSGGGQTCGLLPDGAAYCWGRGTTSPAAVRPGSHFRSLSANSYQTVCGITTAGALECWNPPGSPAPPKRRP